MKKENNLKQNLLKQMDDTPQKKSAEEIIAKDMIRVKRIKLATMISWMLTVTLFIGVGICERSDLRFPDTMLEVVVIIIFPALKVILKAMIFVSVFFTISLYVRSRTLSVKQIHVRLSHIEEQLKNITIHK